MISWQTRTSTSVPIQAILNLLQISSSPVSNQTSIKSGSTIYLHPSGNSYMFFWKSLSSTKGKGQVLSQNNDDMDVDDDDPSGDNFSRGRVVTGEVASFLFLFFLSFDDLFFTQHRRKL